MREFPPGGAVLLGARAHRTAHATEQQPNWESLTLSGASGQWTFMVADADFSQTDRAGRWRRGSGELGWGMVRWFCRGLIGGMHSTGKCWRATL